MAIVKPEYIAELQMQQDLKFWRIYDHSGKVEMNRLLTDVGLDRSVELLQKDLENTSGDYVIVKLYANKPDRKEAGSNYEHAIVRRVSLTPTIGKAAASSTSGLPGFDFMLAMLEKQKALELEMLEMKLSQQSSATDKLIDLLQQPHFITSIFGILNKRPASISGPVNNSVNTATASGRLKSTLDRFAALDPEYIETLEKMAKKCEEDPSILPVLKAGL